MAQVTLYKKGSGNFDASNGWNTLANGTGTDYTNPQNDTPAGTTYKLDLNAVATTLNVDCTVDEIVSSNASTGYLTVSGTRVITGGVTVTGNNNADFVRITTGASLTLNGQAKSSGFSRSVGVGGSGVLTIYNPGGYAIYCANTSTNGVSHGSTGTLAITGEIHAESLTALAISGNCVATITGNVTVTGTGTVGCAIGAGTTTITGDVSVSGTTNSATRGLSLTNASAVTVNGGISAAGSAGDGAYIANTATLRVNGSLSSNSASNALSITSGTVTWVGSRTLAAATDCYISISGGTLVAANASETLALANSGRLCINKQSGTLTVTAAAGTASIVNQSADAQATILGQAVAVTPYPTPAQIAAAVWDDTTSPSRTLTA